MASESPDTEDPDKPAASAESSDSSEDGIVAISDGKAFSWFAKGRATLTVQNNLEVTYGSVVNVAIGLNNDFFFGHKTEVALLSSLEARVGPTFEISESTELNSKEAEDNHYMTAFATTVGASPKYQSRMKALRYAAFTLVTAQTGLMLASAIAAQVRMKKDPENADLEMAWLGVLTLTAPQVAAIGASFAALLMAILTKQGALKNSNEPEGVLSMDAMGGVFLGAQKSAGAMVNRSSGVLMNELGVQISAAKADLKYIKPGDSASIIGFKEDADAKGGARLEISNDGGGRFYGSSMRTALKAPRGGRATHTVLAEEHRLLATEPASLTTTPAGLSVSEAGTLISCTEDTAMSVQTGSVNAIVGGAQGSALRLTRQQSSIGTNTNSLTIDGNGIYISLGGNKLQLRRTSMSFYDNLTVMGNPAPGLFNGLQSAIQDIAVFRAAFSHSTTLDDMEETQFDAERKLINTGNETTITARDKVSKLKDKLKWLV